MKIDQFNAQRKKFLYENVINICKPATVFIIECGNSELVQWLCSTFDKVQFYVTDSLQENLDQLPTFNNLHTTLWTCSSGEKPAAFISMCFDMIIVENAWFKLDRLNRSKLLNVINKMKYADTAIIINWISKLYSTINEMLGNKIETDCYYEDPFSTNQIKYYSFDNKMYIYAIDHSLSVNPGVLEQLSEDQFNELIMHINKSSVFYGINEEYIINSTMYGSYIILSKY